MELIAHKGYPAKYPGNTEESFLGSLKYKPEGIEMDIVIHHGSFYLYHPVKNKVLFGVDNDKVIAAELESMIIGGKTPPIFDLNKIGKKLLEKADYLILDIKQQLMSVIPQIIGVIRESDLTKDQLMVGARTLTRMTLLDNGHSRYKIISFARDPDSYADFIAKGADVIRLFERDITQERIDAIHELGAKVLANPGHPPTGDSPSTSGEADEEILLRLQDMGIDIVLVNDIALARKVIPRKK